MSKSAPVTVAEACHPHCVVCSQRNEAGLGTTFTEMLDGSIRATFPCGRRFQGYTDRLHGGVIAMLLDAAMTHCLFSKCIQAVTAKFDIRYRKPVLVDREATIIARLDGAYPPLYRLSSSLVQDDVVCVTADAKFFGQQA
jgi:uncharacterized protein (TIGR00369 family)